jgi:hypothetical protein
VMENVAETTGLGLGVHVNIEHVLEPSLRPNLQIMGLWVAPRVTP